MEIQKASVTTPLCYKQACSEQNDASGSQETKPLWQTEELQGSYLDMNSGRLFSETDPENRANESLKDIEKVAASKKTPVTTSDIENYLASKETVANMSSFFLPSFKGVEHLYTPLIQNDKDEIIKQYRITISYLTKRQEAGEELTPQEKILLEKIRPLISKLQKRQITAKEFQEQKQQLLTDKVIEEQAEFIPKDAKKLSEEQLHKTKNLYTKTGKIDVALTQVAQEHAADQQQKKEIEIVFVEKAPILRKEIVEKAVKELSKTLDEESVKEYIKSSEPLETIERCYAAAVVENADYLTEEEKEEKLKVIGRNAEEIKEITKQNTEKLTVQIIEARREEQLQEFKANQSAKIKHQENIKEEHKVINNQQLKLENKENRFQQMIVHLLEVIKNSKAKNKGDKKSKEKAEHAKYMKSKLDDKLAAIQSQKRLLENEIEMNERYTTLNIMSMEDDYIRNSSSLLINL